MITQMRTLKGIQLNFEVSVPEKEEYMQSLKVWNEIIDQVVQDLPEGSYYDWRSVQPCIENDGENERHYFIPLAARIVQGIFNRHAPTLGKILEIGSGRIDEQGHSYLGRLLCWNRNQNYSDLTYSDQESVVQQEGHKTRRYEILNLEHIDSIQEKYDVVSGINVLDVLTPRGLQTGIKAIYDSLKDNGVFIVLADRAIDSDLLLRRWDNNFEDFVIPREEEGSLLVDGVKIFKKSDPENRLQTLLRKIPAEWTDFFQKLLNLNAQQRYLFFRLAYCAGTPILSFCNEYLLSECRPVEEFSSREDFAKLVADEMEKAGFTVSMNETVSDSTYGPVGKAKTDINVCVNYLGAVRKSNSPQVRARFPDKIYYETQFLSIVGKKV